MAGKDRAVRREHRAWPWLRALLLAPFVLAALLVIAGQDGRTVLTLDLLHGGRAPLAMLAHDLAGLAGMGAYLFGVLFAYALLVVNPPRRLIADAGRLLGFTLLAACLGYGLLRWMQATGDAEIAAAALRTEIIAPDRWEAVACSRSRAVCVRWEGSLGHASVKGPRSKRDEMQLDLESWQRARAQGAHLEVEWGPTPRGWIFPQAVRAGSLTLRNP